MTKDERSDIGIDRFLKAGAIGTLHYIMRFGKTRISCRIAQRYHNNKNDKVSIVVPSVAVKEEWIKELDNFTVEPDIFTATEAVNLKDYKTGLLIIDELHKFTSTKRLELIKGNIIESKFRLGLTGTYPNDDIIKEYYPVVDTITEEEALNNKWISNFREYNIPLELEMSDKAEYIKYSTIMYEVLSTFKNLKDIMLDTDGSHIFKDDLDVIISCYSGRTFGKSRVKSQHIREYVAVRMGWKPTLDLDFGRNGDIDKYWNPDNIKDRVTNFYKAMKARNDIHNINNVKLNAVLQLYSKFKDKNFIIFNESIAFADIITDTINNTFNTNTAIAYHSGIKSRPLRDFITNKFILDKKGNIKKFGKAKQLQYIKDMMSMNLINAICTAKALDEGLNIENINVVITTSGTANPVQYSQRSARGKTIDKYNKNCVTYIFNLYFDDFMFMVDNQYRHFKSRDKAKLMLRQQNREVKELDLQSFIQNN